MDIISYPVYSAFNLRHQIKIHIYLHMSISNFNREIFSQISFIVDAPLGSKYATVQRQPFSGVLEKSYYERFCKFYRKTFTMKTCLVNLLALASKFIIKESIAGLEWLFSEQLVLNNTSKQQLQYQPFSLYQIPGADVFMV